MAHRQSVRQYDARRFAVALVHVGRDRLNDLFQDLRRWHIDSLFDNTMLDGSLLHSFMWGRDRLNDLFQDLGLVRALDLLRPTLLLPLSAQATVASLTRLGRDLVADFAVVALAAMIDATADSESSTQPIVQRAVPDPSHAIHQ